MKMTVTNLTPAMNLFINDVRQVVRAGGGEQVVTKKIASRLRSLLQEGDILDPRYTRAKPDKFVAYPVWVEPDGSFCVGAVVWNVGQKTPVHDHGTWGVIGIYQGVEHEVTYKPAIVTGARLYKQTGERDISEREVIVCCTSDQDIHRVSCGSNVPCVGIHVYGADIGAIERHVYDPQTGDVRPFVSGWTSVEE
jgi:predicted metal-dependent enzyme (double-stranded beta helix superfamily)